MLARLKSDALHQFFTARNVLNQTHHLAGSDDSIFYFTGFQCGATSHAGYQRTQFLKLAATRPTFEANHFLGNRVA
ncbi:hypothetical protein D3C85_1826940 [compost metagenome]